MAKNKIIFIISLIVCLIIGGVILNSKPKEEKEEPKETNKKGLAIMVFDKTKNDYVKSSEFPKGAYTLNTQKSYCENGTEIGTYDNTTGRIIAKFNKSDKCYYFFDAGKLTPTLTLSADAVTVHTGEDGYRQVYITYNYDGDGEISCDSEYCYVDKEDSAIVFPNCLPHNTSLIVNIIASETDTYESISTTLNVRSCLHPDTLIDYYDKKKKKKLKKKIKDIEEGDDVYTYNYETKQIELKKVKKVTTCKVKEAVALIIKGEKIIIAKGHPVCVSGVGSIDVSLVKEGYELIGSAGEIYTVEKVKIISFTKEQIMYNLLLEDVGNLVIGKIGILCLSLVMVSLCDITNVKAAGYPCWGC